MNIDILEWLEKRQACFPGMDWCHSMPDEVAAWNFCPRGDCQPF